MDKKIYCWLKFFSWNRINVSHVQTSEFMYILPAAPNVNLLEAWINNEIYLSLLCVDFICLYYVLTLSLSLSLSLNFDMKFACNDWNDWLIIIVHVKYSYYSISRIISPHVDLLSPVNCFFLKYLISHQHRLKWKCIVHILINQVQTQIIYTVVFQHSSYPHCNII